MTRSTFLVAYVLLALSVPGLSGTARAETIQIVAIGDSNIEGKGVSSSDTHPAKLERALRAKGHDVRIVNKGITGDTTQGVLARVDSAVPAGTKIAIVWVGINDLRRGVDPATVKVGRQEIASRLRARGIQVLLLGPRHGLADKPQFLVGDKQNHLNAAGYDQIVARTLPQVQSLIGRAKQR